MTNRVKKWYSFLDGIKCNRIIYGVEMKNLLEKIQVAPFVSIILVSVNCIVFILCQFYGEELYSQGCLGTQGIVVEKEYTRFIYSMFLHSNLEHLANNMILLLFMGSMLEKIVGHFPYLVLYFLSGIGGGILSLHMKVIENDVAVSLGASGAIFGLDGLLLAIVIILGYKVQEITVTRVGLMIALSVYNGFSHTNIDNAAHIGGLIVGFLIGLPICAIIRIKDKKRNTQ